MGKAVNEIPEFRQRIAGEKIVEFDNCPTSHTVMKPDGTYAYCEADPSLSWLNYTALQQPVPCPADSNSLITWGRYGKSAGRLLMPVTVLANHALVDGR